MIPRYMWTKSTCNDELPEPVWNHEVRYKADGFTDWEECLLENKTVKVSYTDLTEEQRSAIGIRDVRSFLAVPVFTLQDWWGFVGFADYRKVESWSAAEEDALALVCQPAWQRHRAQAC